MLFFKTRRELLNYLLKNGHIGKGGEVFSGQSVLRKYRELEEEVFCREVYRDDCYEKFWKIGFNVGIESTKENQNTVTTIENKSYPIPDPIPAVGVTRAPANSLSRMCGEIAMICKEGYLTKVDRGVYRLV